MGYKYEHLMKLTQKQLHNHGERLKKKGVQALIVAERIREVEEQKALKRRRQLHRAQMRSQWGVIMIPLMREKKTVRSLLLYKDSKSHEERKLALEGYMLVIERVEQKLRELMRTQPEDADFPLTPMQYDNTKKHWTDYVPQHIKDRVCLLFDAIPHYPKMKVKHPFPRTMPEDLHNKLKARLVKRTEKDLRRAKQDALLSPDDERHKELVQRITKALSIIDDLDSNEPVPATWHGLF